MFQAYSYGSTVEIKATFQDPTTGDYYDPDTVTFKVLKPDGTTVSPPSVKDGVGQWHAATTANQPGFWYWRVDTLTPTGGSESRFRVMQTKFA